jgi:wyosine [tRNA(Phe)-imidazoG37] synthetase (radical SAM superfamily)
MLLTPKDTIVYGPVRSRRLGRSLGINLLPAGRKVCSFDCRYCQYGFAPAVVPGSRPQTGVAPGAESRATFPEPDQVLAAVETALGELEEAPAWLTFSGNGEPSFHPRFAEIVDRLIAVRDRRAPQARTAVLSNSTRVGDAGIRSALSRLDARIMKLDVGTELGFRRFNQAAASLSLEAIVDGLARLGDVTLQALFAGGPSGNLEPTEIAAWCDAATRIRPRAVQLYTLDRDAPDAGLTRARPEELREIQARLSARGIAATAY